MPSASTETKVRLAFVAFFLAGILLRFTQLGNAPLDEGEAQQALAAYNLSEGNPATGSEVPIYTILTSLSFSLFGSSDWLARFWPALIGSSLVLLIYLLRELLGRASALTLAAGVAVLPAFVATSRFAGGDVFVLLSLGLIWLSLDRQRWQLLGFALALALLSGPALLVGASILLFCLVLLFTFFRKSNSSQWLLTRWTEISHSIDRRAVAIAFLVSLILLGTAFLTRFNAFGLVGSSLASFVQSWGGGQGIPLNLFAFSLLKDATPWLLIALLALFTNRKDNPSHQFFLIWLLIAIVFLLIFPGRRAEDLVWLLLPCLGLAAALFERWLKLPKENQVPIWATFALLILLMLFQWLNFARTSNAEILMAGLVAGGILLLVTLLAMVLIGGGWSMEVPLHALAMAAVLGLSLMALAQSSRIGRDHPLTPNLLWRGGVSAGQANLLQQSLMELSTLNYGRTQELTISNRVDSAAMVWLLRDWNTSPEEVASPDVIITLAEASGPEEGAAYRGQDFVWVRQVSWGQTAPPNIFAWLLYHKGPIATQNVALWAREDLFPSVLEDNGTDENIEEATILE